MRPNAGSRAGARRRSCCARPARCRTWPRSRERGPHDASARPHARPGLARGGPTRRPLLPARATGTGLGPTWPTLSDRPAKPCALNRCTQSRNVCRSMPVACAASVRDAPSRTNARAQHPARCWNVAAALGRLPQRHWGEIGPCDLDRCAHADLRESGEDTANHASCGRGIPHESHFGTGRIMHHPTKRSGRATGPLEPRRQRQRAEVEQAAPLPLEALRLPDVRVGHA